MPLYEYKCNSCGKKFEVLQKFSDSPLKTHDECGGEVERLLSAPAFHLKGSGWYATDYGKGNAGKPADTKAETGDKAEKSDKSDKAEKSDKKDSGTASTETKSSPAEAKPAPAPAAVPK